MVSAGLDGKCSTIADCLALPRSRADIGRCTMVHAIQRIVGGTTVILPATPQQRNAAKRASVIDNYMVLRKGSQGKKDERPDAQI